MIGCTRCGRWHLDAEAAEGRRLTCTEVREYWADLRAVHRGRYGHYPKIARGDHGEWVCIACNRKLQQHPDNDPGDDR